MRAGWHTVPHGTRITGLVRSRAGARLRTHMVSDKQRDYSESSVVKLRTAPVRMTSSPSSSSYAMTAA